jgi:hypothetical protein
MSASLADPTGSSLVGFKQSGTGAVNRTVQDKARELVSVKDMGALGNATGDQASAINATTNALARFPATGSGGKRFIPPGKYRISSPIYVRANETLEGGGSDSYTSVIELNDDFVGEAAIIVTDPLASYVSAHVKNLGINLRNIAGVNGISYYGAYRNASIENVVAIGVAGDAHGIKVTTQDGGITVCESLLLKDIYVIKQTGVTHTKSGVFLEKCQESTLINVKSFHSTNPGPIGGAACLHVRDSRGIVVINGGFLGGDNGILVDAVTRQVDGVTLLNPTFENIGTAELKLLGTSTYVVSNVQMPTARRESPVSPAFVDINYAQFVDVNIANGGAVLGANVNNTVIRDNGAGTITATTGAQYTRLSSGNAVRANYQVGPGLDLVAPVSTPRLSFNVLGKSTSYRFDWSANSTNDNGFRLVDTGSNIVFNYLGGNFDFQQNPRINKVNPRLDWLVPSRTGSYVWHWSADATNDFGFQMRVPSGATAVLVSDTGSAAKLGFFGASAVAKPTGTPAAATDAATTQALVNSLRASLVSLGLIA